MAHCGHYLDVVHAEPIAELNTFLGAPQDASLPPTHAQARHLLPRLWGTPWPTPAGPFPGQPSSAPASASASASTSAAHAAACSAAFSGVFEHLFRNLKAAEPCNDFAGPYADAAFNACLFMWDSVFMAVFWKYASRAFPFQRTLDTFYRKQCADGFIPREIRESDGRSQFHRHDPHSTGPNVLPWCEWEYFQLTGDGARLAAVFPPLLAYHKWMRANRSWPDGSYHSCGYACGMDNQPRVQPGESVTASHSFTAWVDATSQALLSATCLLSMAQALQRGAGAGAGAGAAAGAAAPTPPALHAGPGPQNLYTLSSVLSGMALGFPGGVGGDGVCSAARGTPVCLLPIPGSVCLEVQLRLAPTSAFLDLKYGQGVHGNPVWAYSRNSTVSQYWVPLVALPGGSTIPYHAALALRDAPASPATSPAAAATAAHLRGTGIWTILLRSAVRDTLVLACGEGGALCVQECPASATPALRHLWRLTPAAPADAAAAGVVAVAGGADCAALRGEAALLRAYLRERMWCREQGCFTDVRLAASPGYPAGGERSRTRSVGAYWALVAGMGDSLGEAELLQFLGALDDCALFNRPTRVPSLAANHAQYDPMGGYWLGSSCAFLARSAPAAHFSLFVYLFAHPARTSIAFALCTLCF